MEGQESCGGHCVPQLDSHFPQVGQLLEDPSGLQHRDVIVIQSPMWEGRRRLAGVRHLLSHRDFVELCPNFIASKVQENLEKLQYEVRGLARRGGWERTKRDKSTNHPMSPSWDSGFLHAVQRHTLLFKRTKTTYLPPFVGGPMATQTPQGNFLRVS